MKKITSNLLSALSLASISQSKTWCNGILHDTKKPACLDEWLNEKLHNNKNTK